LKSTRYLVRTGRCYAWPTLPKKDGDELFDYYRHTLEILGNEKGLLGLIILYIAYLKQHCQKLFR
jgi:hypothetical protein